MKYLAKKNNKKIIFFHSGPMSQEVKDSIIGVIPNEVECSGKDAAAFSSVKDPKAQYGNRIKINEKKLAELIEARRIANEKRYAEISAKADLDKKTLKEYEVPDGPNKELLEKLLAHLGLRDG